LTEYQCKSCNSDFELINGSCYAPCNSGQYRSVVNTNECISCPPNCAECSQTHSDITVTCQTCDYGYEVKVNNGEQCWMVCGDGTFLDTINNNCVQCSTGCKKCEGNSDTCLICEDNYWYLDESQCVLSCPDGKYGDNNSKTCNQCHSSCSTCSGGLDDECTSCSSNHFLDSSSDRCLIVCPIGKTGEIESNMCVDCHSSCKTCAAPDLEDQCLSCYEPQLLMNSLCKDNCEEGYFGWHQICYKCHKACKTCKGKYSTDCLSCRDGRFFSGALCELRCMDGFYGDSITNTCIKCHESCSRCSDGTDTNCQSCNISKFLFESQCREYCPEKYYQNDASHTCESCSLLCKTCTGDGPSKCSSCNPGRFLHQNQCLVECPKTFWKDSTKNECRECISPCNECSLNPTNCTSCIEEKLLNENSCIDKCPPGKYTNGTHCLSCSGGCETCIETPLNCTSCRLNLTLFESDCHCPLKKIYSKETDECVDFHESDKIKIVNATFIEEKKIIEVHFSNKIRELDIQNFTFSFEDMDNTAGLNITKIERGSNEKHFKIYLEFLSQVDSKNLLMDAKWKWAIRSSVDNTTLFQDYPINVTVFYFEAQLENLLKATDQGAGLTMSIITLLVSISSVGAFLILVKLFQSFGYLLFLNLTIPSNTKTFLKIFKQNPLSMIPNPIQRSEEGLNCGLDPKIIENDLQCFILNNVGGLLVQILGCVAVKLILMYLREKLKMTFEEKVVARHFNYRCRRLKHLLSKIVGYFNNMMNLNFFCALFYGMQVDYFLGISPLPIAMNMEVPYNNITMTPVLMFIFPYIGLFLLSLRIYNIYFSVRSELSMKDRIQIRKLWGSYLNLYDDFRKDCKSGALYYPIIIAKDTFLPFIIVYTVKVRWFQCFLYVSTELIVANFLWRTRPFKRRLIFIQNFMNSVLMATVAALFLISHLFRKELGEKETYYYFGFPLIGLLMLIIVCNVGVGVWDFIYMIIKKISSEKTNKIEPISNKDLSQAEVVQNVSEVNITMNPANISGLFDRSRESETAGGSKTPSISLTNNGSRVKEPLPNNPKEKSVKKQDRTSVPQNSVRPSINRNRNIAIKRQHNQSRLADKPKAPLNC